MDEFDIYYLYTTAIDSFKDKILPPFIKDHPGINSRTKVKKIFPSLGLDNFSIPTKMTREMVIEEKLPLIQAISSSLIVILDNARTRLDAEYTYFANEFESSSAIRARKDKFDERLAEFTSFLHSIPIFPPVDDSGKISLILPSGEKFFKAYQKLQESLSYFAIDIHSKFSIPSLDSIPIFKTFLQQNIPISNLFINFSSQDDGLYDIATMSERGISSCQSWDHTSEHKLCLVGSILSKYVGIIFLSSNSPYNSLGSKMIRRCIVRYGIHKHNSAPTIVLDKMYPEHDPSTAKLFLQALKEKSSIPVLDLSDAGSSSIIAPKETLPISPKEYSYQDTLTTQLDIEGDKRVKNVQSNKYHAYQLFITLTNDTDNIINSPDFPDRVKSLISNSFKNSLQDAYDKYSSSYTDFQSSYDLDIALIKTLFKDFSYYFKQNLKYNSNIPGFQESATTLYNQIKAYLFKTIKGAIDAKDNL